MTVVIHFGCSCPQLSDIFFQWFNSTTLRYHFWKVWEKRDNKYFLPVNEPRRSKHTDTLKSWLKTSGGAVGARGSPGPGRSGSPFVSGSRAGPFLALRPGLPRGWGPGRREGAGAALRPQPSPFTFGPQPQPSPSALTFGPQPSLSAHLRPLAHTFGPHA